MPNINLVMSSYKTDSNIVATKSTSQGWPLPIPYVPSELVSHIQSLIPAEAQETIENFNKQQQAIVLARRDYLNNLKSELSPLIETEIEVWIKSHPEHLL